MNDKKDIYLGLANALQLSISERLVSVSHQGQTIIFRFSHSSESDDRLIQFVRLLGHSASWIAPGQLEWAQATTGNMELMTELLLLTRLQPQNLSAIFKQDDKFKIFQSQINASTIGSVVSVEDYAQVIFDELEKQERTQKDLAQCAGLSQITLTNFKKGADIKLSNYLELLRCLNLDINITRKK